MQKDGWKYLKTARTMVFAGKIARAGSIVKLAPLDATYFKNRGLAVEATAAEVTAAGEGVIELPEAYIQSAHSF